MSGESRIGFMGEHGFVRFVTVVVDLGCHHHPDHQGTPQNSIARLLERFRPDVLYGFDPHPDVEDRSYHDRGARVVISRRAAWLHYGFVPYTHRPGTLSGFVGQGDVEVPCFDLADWLTGLRAPVVLKMDVQGAEYPLLDRLITRGVHEALDLLLVEWHEVESRARERDSLLERLACPVEEWEL